MYDNNTNPDSHHVVIDNFNDDVVLEEEESKQIEYEHCIRIECL